MKQEERKRVLVVDDNRTLLTVLRDFLTFKGFDVVTAESGEEGLEKIGAIPPDIILLDISMPGMGGVGFLKRITSSEGKRAFPVLVFTARATAKDFSEAIAVDGFLAKPCDKGELVNRIRDILSKHPSAHATESEHLAQTVLIGEDDQTTAEKLLSVFQDAGFKAERVRTGPEVLEMAAVRRPAAVLLKQILPGIDGSAVASLLRSMPRTQSIPVVLYEASGAAEKDGRSPAEGISKYMATGNAAALLSAVREVLQAGVPMRGGPAASPGRDCG